MSSVIMAAAAPGLLNVVMDIKPLTSGVAIVTDLPASDSESAGIYVSDSHAGTQIGLHRVTLRKGSRILSAWYVNLTNTGNRDIAYDSDRMVLINNDKTGYDLNPDQSGVTIGTVNNSNVQQFADAEWKRLWEQVTLIEGYATTGVIHSASQILYLVMSILQNPQYLNDELIARKLDGNLEAAAFLMDSPTTPAQHKRIR